MATNSRNDEAIASLRRYWDEVVQGEPADPRDLDPALAATVRHLHARDDALGADPRFADRLLEDLMHATTALGAVPFPHNPDTTPMRDDHAAPTSVSWPQPQPQPDTRRVRWVLAQVATAALLVLALVGSLFAVGLLRPDAEAPLAHLVAVGTPPPTSPVAFVWQTEGGPDLPLDDPINPFFDPQGNLWVIDGRNSRFQIFAPDGTFLEAWGTPGSAEGQFDFVDPAIAGGYGQAGAAFDAAGNLYVADPGNYRIQKFGPDRSFITAWGSKGQEDGQFLALLDLAVDGQGRVYASDEMRNVVQVFDSAGQLLAVWGGPDADEGWLPNPAAIEVGADGNIWINHFRQARIQKVSPDGVLLATLGQTGSGAWDLGNPSAEAFDEQGRVYVAEWGTNRVQVFDADGHFLATWGGFGRGEGQFMGLSSIALDGQGNVVTAEDSSDRVQKFRLLPPLAP